MNKIKLIEGIVSFTIRVPECKRSLTISGVNNLVTTLRDIEFRVCDKLGMDPITTVFVVTKQYNREELCASLSLFENGVNNGDVLIARVETTSKTSGHLRKTEVNQYVDDEDMHRYYPDYKYTTYGMTIEGSCRNARCVAYNKTVNVPMGSGEFSFMATVKTVKCPCCPYRDRGGNPPIDVSAVKFSNCFWRYEGDYLDKNKFKARDFSRGWYKVTGEDLETFLGLLKGQTWVDLKIFVRQL